ncbi:hypothetical protein [Halorubrum sp. F4]|uniref:hypothetical protein n=1 Tax=Halorubrum sp. F4 TaxID=2989715 RepID=UPI0024811110|nr:hypothetical protein [Halorubrum sp. F4]
MEAKTTRGLETPDREEASAFTTTADPLAILRRADRAAHDVAQTSLAEFDGEIDLYPENHV